MCAALLTSRPMRALSAPAVPGLRIGAPQDRPVHEARDYVLYWMIAARRTTWNFGLQRAVEWARRLDRPLLVLEPLRCGHRWASDRLHRFALDGMAENARRFARLPVTYFPYVEPERGAGSGLLEALSARACVVVTDEFPCFFIPQMVAAAASRLDVRLEVVDGNGLLPLRAAAGVSTTARAFRRVLQQALPIHLRALPLPEPLAGVELPAFGLDELPLGLRERWPAARGTLLADDGDRSTAAGRAGAAAALAHLPIDHAVGVVETRGGSAAAGAAVKDFLARKLERYAAERSEPDADAGSGLSPWLHFGHVAAHAVFAALARHEGWGIGSLGARTDGRREGFWGMSPGAEAFLDELVTWRELGFNITSQRTDFDSYDSLPDWALATLEKHAGDRRERIYTLEQFTAAATHDPLWNAAQRQLLAEGRIHGYLRMLWGKKVIEWTPSARLAAQHLIELNNRWALDGRDPGSYSGIFWCLGRYDRPWAPERAVFGTVRWMSSANTARKLGVDGYLARHGSPAPQAR
jgi:deoxyribodipyrimidine photo-lyase